MPGKVLVVEDNPTIRMIVRMVLVLDHYQVLEADNGQRGLEALEGNPDCALVITDLEMKVMDGYEMIERIRHGGRTLPILVLTAEEGGAEALRRGADLVVQKPFSSVDLLDKIQRMLAARSDLPKGTSP